jgi:hypothetical protein
MSGNQTKGKHDLEKDMQDQPVACSLWLVDMHEAYQYLSATVGNKLVNYLSVLAALFLQFKPTCWQRDLGTVNTMPFWH